MRWPTPGSQVLGDEFGDAVHQDGVPHRDIRKPPRVRRPLPVAASPSSRAVEARLPENRFQLHRDQRVGLAGDMHRYPSLD